MAISHKSILPRIGVEVHGVDPEVGLTVAESRDLPDVERAAIEGLRVVHSLEPSQRAFVPDPSPEQLAAWRRVRPRERPLVWTHLSGRKSLVLGVTASHVVGMEEGASGALIDRLQAWATRPEFVYRHVWRPGDVVMWDNRGTMHRASAYAATTRRVMRRVELAGEEAIA